MSDEGFMTQYPTRVPPELLFIIKEYIPQSDLRSHVCFYSTCRTTAALYGDNSEQAAFWRRACALSGIGWLRSDSSWKEIAFETITRDGFCPHPHCGGALLDWNASQVERAMRMYNWDPEEGAWDASFDEFEAVEWMNEDRPSPVCSPIFRYMLFHPQRIAYVTHKLPTDVALGPIGPDSCVSEYRRWITSHPIATRSLATFPAVRRMRFHYDGLMYGSKANNLSGVTVWDVLRSITNDLDEELTVPQLLGLLTGPFDRIFRDKSSNNFVRDLTKYSTLRGLWTSSQWDGLLFLRSDGDGPVFKFLFSRRLEEPSVDATSVFTNGPTTLIV